jgi:hypothetical protein
MPLTKRVRPLPSPAPREGARNGSLAPLLPKTRNLRLPRAASSSREDAQVSQLLLHHPLHVGDVHHGLSHPSLIVLCLPIPPVLASSSLFFKKLKTLQIARTLYSHLERTDPSGLPAAHLPQIIARRDHHLLLARLYLPTILHHVAYHPRHRQVAGQDHLAHCPRVSNLSIPRSSVQPLHHANGTARVDLDQTDPLLTRTSSHNLFLGLVNREFLKFWKTRPSSQQFQLNHLAHADLLPTYRPSKSMALYTPHNLSRRQRGPRYPSQPNLTSRNWSVRP